jgi:hypothetical protein
MLRHVHLFFVCAGLLLCARICSAQTSNAKAATGSTGSITGRIIDSAGEPLAGASVYARLISSDVRPKTATADSHGNFKLAGLEPGLYAISAAMPGYVNEWSPGSDERPNYYRLGDSVTLTLKKGGVITGTVTGKNGPTVGVGVFASQVRDADGRKLTSSFPGNYEKRTDDRGIFRIYGLPPGAYIVMASRPRIGTILPSAYDNDVPTFYPSGTRDTAAQIVVREGEEITADIQYRGEPGHALSGTISGLVANNQIGFTPGPQITLTDARDQTPLMNSPTSLTDKSAFAIYGVPDGEYELTARQYLPTRDELRSPSLRVIIRGADVIGVNLKLGPLASIAGRIAFENEPNLGCGKRKETAAFETLVYARRLEPAKGSERKGDDSQMWNTPASYSAFVAADAKKSFTLRNLTPSSYRIDPQPPASGWYVRSVTTGPTPTNSPKTSGLSEKSGVIRVRSGERFANVMVTIAEGAAVLSGQVSMKEGQGSLPRVRIYLVPAEREASGNVYRFHEAAAGTDGKFILDNLAPGRYWIVARHAEEDDLGTTKSIRQDETLRAKILQEGETMKKAVSFKPCEQVGDFGVQAPSSPR